MTKFKEKKSVCIIGAGIAGAVAARLLHQKDYNVTILEKSNRIGGKCMTLMDNGEPYELGACSIGPSYKTILKLGRQTHQPLKRRKEFSIYDEINQKFTSVHRLFVKKDFFRITIATIKFFFIALKLDRKINKDETDISSEFHVPFLEWCERKNLLCIADWFKLPVVSFGYGHLNQIKTFYVLRYLNHKNIIAMWFIYVLGLTSALRRFKNGYQSLVESLVSNINTHLNTNIISICRNNENVSVTTQDGTFTFDSLIIACPLDLIIDKMDASQEEKSLVNDLISYPYHIICCEIKGFPKKNVLIKHNVDNEQYGHVTLIENEGDEKDICVSYVLEGSFSTPIENNINFLKEDVAKMGFEVGRIHKTVAWNYFPHFKKFESYKILHLLQGKQNTFYAGGMCSFELAEVIAHQTERLIIKHFPGKLKQEKFSKLKNIWYWIWSGVRIS